MGEAIFFGYCAAPQLAAGIAPQWSVARGKEQVPGNCGALRASSSTQMATSSFPTRTIIAYSAAPPPAVGTVALSQAAKEKDRVRSSCIGGGRRPALRSLIKARLS